MSEEEDTGRIWLYGRKWTIAPELKPKQVKELTLEIARETLPNEEAHLRNLKKQFNSSILRERRARHKLVRLVRQKNYPKYSIRGEIIDLREHLKSKIVRERDIRTSLRNDIEILTKDIKEIRTALAIGKVNKIRKKLKELGVI